eukprot:gene19293-gene19836
MNFTTPVQQSAALQNAGLPAPLPLADADLLQPATKQARRVEAEQYLFQVRSNLAAGDADPTDVDAAEIYRSQVINAESMSSIQRNLAPIAAVDVAAVLLGPINAQFAQLAAQLTAQTAQLTALTAQLTAGLNQMRARHTNGFAKHLTHAIVPLPVMPPAVPGGPVPALPPFFPATRQDLINLTSPQVTALLQYYSEPTNGTVDVRRARLIEFLGLPP